MLTALLISERGFRGKEVREELCYMKLFGTLQHSLEGQVLIIKCAKVF